MMSIKVWCCSILMSVALWGPCVAQDLGDYERRELSIWALDSGNIDLNPTWGGQGGLTASHDWRARITDVFSVIETNPRGAIGLQRLGLGNFEKNAIKILADAVVNRKITLTFNF